MKPTEDLVQEHKAIKVMLGVMKNIANNIAENRAPDTDDLLRIVEFLKVFADRCHHGKEENALFPAMVAAGMPEKSGPIAVMLHDHALGRNYISDLENGIRAIKAGQPAQAVENALLSYVDLLRSHILKEESILFPMADRLLEEEKQQEISEIFSKIEEEVIGKGVHEQFEELLELLVQKYK